MNKLKKKSEANKPCTLKMTLMFSPRGSKFWKDNLRGTALELKKEHDWKKSERSQARKPGS